MIALRKIEQWLWFLFLIMFPFQRRIVLFQTDWYFQEWRSGFLYFSDIILIGLLIVWLWQKRPSLKKEYVLFSFLAVAGLSIFSALVTRVAFHSWVRLLEGVLLYLYISQYALERFSLSRSFMALLTGAVIQAGIAIGQFFHQADLGLRFLGESFFNSNMRGIASFFIPSGEKIIRAYGTFPHPNVLAVYLLFVLIVVVHWFQQSKKKWLLMPYGILLFGLLVTFSRTVIVAGGLLGLFWGIQELMRNKKLAFWIGGVTVGVMVLFTSLFPQAVLSRLTLSSEEEAVQLRFYYNQEALKVGEHHINLLGVGMGNFVSWLMDTQRNLPSGLFQPVHNLFLLIYAELGLIGASLFLLWLAQKIWPHVRSHRWMILVVFASFIFIALFDHFFWTIQQGRFVWWMVLGLLFSKHQIG
ncbi:MAG: O-antigen ligase family protein [Candidatus Yanofskybacteria bacterium]|nr:O-antigen ligase family protein [Candidatus Yanofskybacteria bacterium]